MPINKAAQFRFEIIDECLRNTKRKWSKATLLNFVNRRLELHFGEGASISSSQLRYDLEHMQLEYDAPIKMYREGRCYLYRYEDPNFSIKILPVNEDEISKLNTAVELLRQIKGFSMGEEAADVVSKLENRLDAEEQDKRTLIEFDDTSGMKGIENLEDIYYAVKRGNVLKITYQAFTARTPREWNVHPYVLKEYANRWYVLGFCEEKKALGVYSVDRMKEIRISKLPFDEIYRAEAANYFNDILGVTRFAGQPVEQIELLFNPVLAPYILTKPIHPSQMVVEQFDTGEVKIGLHLIINPELVSTLLGYGSAVKVIAPQKLSCQLQSMAKSMIENYK